MHIKVRVETGAKNESVKVVSDGRFEISVREKPLDNAANERVVALIARHFRVAPPSVHITKGHHRPSKILTVVLGPDV